MSESWRCVKTDFNFPIHVWTGGVLIQYWSSKAVQGST